jgi:dTDP-glucose pyrophosphorylase
MWNRPNRNLAECCIRLENSLREAVAAISLNRTGIVVLVDEDRKLLGTLTDGDVRRALLAGMDLTTPLSKLVRDRVPIWSSLDADYATLVALLHTKEIRQIPLLDANGRVADLVTLEDLLPGEVVPLQAVIMAGGFGQRLHPLTENMPKPMLPVGDKPIMELIIGQLREFGIRKVNVTTHYEPEKIRDYFGDGQAFGVDLNYVPEESPLGTAGALSLMDEKTEPLLVINGDILTQVDFRSMLSFHREQRAVITVGVRQYDLQVPYGVVESDGVVVTGLREKPVLNFFVNAGIYLLEPAVHQFIPSGQRFDMTDLIKILLKEGHLVASFPIVEYWLDIGQHADYAKAQEDVKTWGQPS